MTVALQNSTQSDCTGGSLIIHMNHPVILPVTFQVSLSQLLPVLPISLLPLPLLELSMTFTRLSQISGLGRGRLFVPICPSSFRAAAVLTPPLKKKIKSFGNFIVLFHVYYATFDGTLILHFWAHFEITVNVHIQLLQWVFPATITNYCVLFMGKVGELLFCLVDWRCAVSVQSSRDTVALFVAPVRHSCLQMKVTLLGSCLLSLRARSHRQQSI